MSVVELSKLSGVSIATVSRVLNRNPQVSPASVAAVEQAIARIGYSPRHRYRRRRKGGEAANSLSSGNFAFLFPDSSDQALRTPLSGRFMQGVTEALMSKHMNMLCTALQPDGDVPLCIRQRQVDGVIVRGSVPVAHIEANLKLLPVVWLLEMPRIPKHGDQVLEDTDAIGEIAAQYLMERSAGSLAVVNFDVTHPCYQRRAESFTATARRAGVEVHTLVDPIPEKLADMLVALNPRPGGVFLPFPEAQMIGVHRRLVEHGIRPGRDMNWIGCGYDPVGMRMLDPGLANIDIRAEAMGTAAVEMLLWRLGHSAEPQRRLMIAPALVEPAAQKSPA